MCVEQCRGFCLQEWYDELHFVWMCPICVHVTFVVTLAVNVRLSNWPFCHCVCVCEE